jgi:hypothetical protein
VERLIAMLDEQAVEGHPEGGIVVAGVRWLEVEPGVFQYEEGGPHHVAFVRSGGERLYFYPYGSRTAYERVPFGFGYGTTVAVLSGAALLALVALPAGALALRRASRVRLAGTTCVSLAHGALLIAGSAAVAGTFGFADPQRLFAGMPLTLRAGLTALDASVVLLGLLMILLGRDYSRGQLADRHWTRLMLTGYCLGQVGALPWLVYWQLV